MVHRSPNSHVLKTRDFPFVDRLKREDVIGSAYTLIGFATQAEADEMQRWIAASGIETRPASPKYDGPQLSVSGSNK